jgi:hypothetical protein
MSARRLSDHDLVLAVGDIEPPGCCYEESDRHQQGNDVRGGQHRNPQIDQHGLAILDDQIELPLVQGLREERDKSKTADNRQQGSQHVLEEITLKPGHKRT